MLPKEEKKTQKKLSESDLNEFMEIIKEIIRNKDRSEKLLRQPV